jgi:hypothetical protein
MNIINIIPHNNTLLEMHFNPFIEDTNNSHVIITFPKSFREEHFCFCPPDITHNKCIWEKFVSSYP